MTASTTVTAKGLDRRRALFFRAPGEIAVMEESLPARSVHEILVRAACSAISAGTELRLFRGQVPLSAPADINLPSLEGNFAYPLKYGYSLVGEVVEPAGRFEAGQRVFAFHPHEELFAASPAELVPIPPDIDSLDAVFLAAMETAVGFAMDLKPMIGERGIIFGQGILGLLTTGILSRFPLGSLLTIDRYEPRRRASLGLGATITLQPGAPDIAGFNPDFIIEASGDISALMRAVEISEYNTRIVVGSWYADDRVSHSFGLKFHRHHVRLQSSQVSLIGPEHRGRWDKTRRFETAWEMIRKIKPSGLISHRLPFSHAARAYELLDKRPGEAMQVILEY